MNLCALRLSAPPRETKHIPDNPVNPVNPVKAETKKGIAL